MKFPVRAAIVVLLGFGALATSGDQAGPPPASTPSPAARPTPRPEAQLEEFVPSEKVKADDAVSFPVDI